MATNMNDNPEENQVYECNCKAAPPGKKGRNLIITIDGAFHKFGDQNTHIIQLYSQLEKNGRDQLAFFNSGIGAYTKPSWKSLKYWQQVINYKMDLATAWNLEKVVTGAYQWLTENYNDGDKIYLFGSSRSADRVCTLAVMIRRVGLMRGGNEEQIPFAYYLSRKPVELADASLEATSVANGPSSDSNRIPSLEIPSKAAQRFKNIFSRDVHVHFIGIWDADFSLVDVNSPCGPALDNCCFLRHARVLEGRQVSENDHSGIIVDEILSKRLQPKGPNSDDMSSLGSIALASIEDLADFQSLMDEKQHGEQWKIPHVKEVWFPESHLGGENVINHVNRRPSLLWMSREAVWAGLKLKSSA